MIFDINNDTDTMTIMQYTGHANCSLGITSGCFDIFHLLHLQYLERCRRYCDFLMVGVDSDDFVKSTKGPNRPFYNDCRRIHILNGLRCVDYVFVMGGTNDLKKACRIFQPNVMFKNQVFETGVEIVGREFCTEIKILPDIDNYDSTTEIIEAIQERGQTKK